MMDPNIKYLVNSKIRYRDKDGHRQECTGGMIVGFEEGDKINPDFLVGTGAIEEGTPRAGKTRGGGGDGTQARKKHKSLSSGL